MPHKPCADGGNERDGGTDRQIERQHGGSEVGEDTADIQRGDRLGEKEGQDRERFARTDLKPAVCERHEGVGQRNVQRGDHARAADALGGKKVSEHEKTSVFLFGSVDRKPSVPAYSIMFAPRRQAIFAPERVPARLSGADGWGGRRSARTKATARPRPRARAGRGRQRHFRR